VSPFGNIKSMERLTIPIRQINKLSVSRMPPTRFNIQSAQGSTYTFEFGEKPPNELSDRAVNLIESVMPSVRPFPVVEPCLGTMRIDHNILSLKCVLDPKRSFSSALGNLEVAHSSGAMLTIHFFGGKKHESIVFDWDKGGG
jgi:hypothetical protein